MDKYTFNIKADKIQKLVKKGDFATAAKIADTVEWEEVHSVRILTIAAAAYERIRDYKTAIELLEMAYEESTVGKRILYKLTGLAIADGDVQRAQRYYDMFLQEAPGDNGRYLLRYLLSELKKEPLDKRIAILETYRRFEFEEEWALRLAELYDEAGMKDACVKLCDEIILWFGVGSCVDEAMTLKEKYEPLTASQMQRRENKEIYEKRLKEVQAEYTEESRTPGTPAEEALPEEQPAQTPAEEELPAEQPEAAAALPAENSGETKEPTRRWIDRFLFVEAAEMQTAVKGALNALSRFHEGRGEEMKRLTSIRGSRANELGIIGVLVKTGDRDLMLTEASALTDESLNDLLRVAREDPDGAAFVMADTPNQLAYLDARLGKLLSRMEKPAEEELPAIEIQEEEMVIRLDELPEEKPQEEAEAQAEAEATKVLPAMMPAEEKTEETAKDNTLVFDKAAETTVTFSFAEEMNAARERAAEEARRRAAEEAARAEAEKKAAEEEARKAAEKAAQEAIERKAAELAAEKLATAEAIRRTEEAACREKIRRAEEENSRKLTELEAAMAAAEAARAEAEKKLAEMEAAKEAGREAERKAAAEAEREAERKAAEEAARKAAALEAARAAKEAQAEAERRLAAEEADRREKEREEAAKAKTVIPEQPAEAEAEAETNVLMSEIEKILAAEVEAAAQEAAVKTDAAQDTAGEAEETKAPAPPVKKPQKQMTGAQKKAAAKAKRQAEAEAAALKAEEEKQAQKKKPKAEKPVQVKAAEKPAPVKKTQDSPEPEIAMFVNRARTYLASIDCVTDENGEEALREAAEDRREQGIALTQEEAETMIEEAADRAEKRNGLFTRRYDRDGCLIIRAKDII